MNWVLFLRLLVLLEVGTVDSPDKEISENGKAHGRFQLTQAFVNEVNRILGEEKFVLEDAHRKSAATGMVLVWHRYWSRKRGTYGDLISMARQHRSGPDGHFNEKSEEYGRRASTILENM